ncbi:MAG: Ig-like domain-containing protein [Candidatus Helarchaeota archaeon]|nr:Ig-like domain-containing protein [Candidatus Helarchaeota archaeon]
MKKTKLRLMALIFLFAFFNVFTTMYILGTLNAVAPQNMESSANFPDHLEVFEDSPSIGFDSEQWAWNVPARVYANIWDAISLDDAYYQVDSWEPTGTDPVNWIPIFTDYSGNSWTGLIVIDSDIFNGLSEGQHFLYVKAWDDDSNVTDGSGVHWPFFKDTIPPDVAAIISPSDGATVSGNITISAAAQDNVGGSGVSEVKFYFGHPDNGTQIGKNWTAPYTLKLDTTTVADGSYTLYIRVYDDAGNYIDSEGVTITIDNTPEEPNLFLILVIVAVGAIAAAAVTTYVVKYRRRPASEWKTKSKLAKPKQPMSSKRVTPVSSEPQAPTYTLAEDSEGMFEVSDKLTQLPLTEAQRQELAIDLQGLPSAERVPILDAVIGPISVTEAEFQLNNLMKEIENLEKQENWTKLLAKLDKGVELAEFVGDQAIFTQLLTKIDEIRATKI